MRKISGSKSLKNDKIPLSINLVILFITQDRTLRKVRQQLVKSVAFFSFFFFWSAAS